MKIEEPKVELWKDNNNLENHIARCARVCYASNKTDNNSSLCNRLIQDKHYSMFRHYGIYLIIPQKIQIDNRAYIDAAVVLIEGKYYISINMQAFREYWDNYYRYVISQEEAENNEIFRKYKLLRYTFCVETGIDITRELNRKSPNSIAEQSTRYVDFLKKIGIRFKKCHWMHNLNFYKKCLVYLMCKTSEWFYKLSRSKYGLNLQPQDARWILPLDTMSKAVYTYTVADWERIINMRLWDWTGKAHNDAKVVARQICNLLEGEGYIIENYKENERNKTTASM